MKKYDAIIIGSGQAGNPLARRLSGKGWKVLIIERDVVGGSCINYGCTPTKAMIASAKNAYQARRAADYGLTVPDVAVHLKAIVERKDKIVHKSRSGTEKGLVLPHIDLVYGEASFIAAKAVRVTRKNDHEDYSAGYIFINTGTRTAIPGIKGLEDIPYLTSTSVLDLTAIPEHLLIIGGSYIALEFGQMFWRFGSEVTIIAKEGRFLPKEDEDVAAAVKAVFKKEGIDILTGADTSEIMADQHGVISLSAKIKGRKKTITGSHLLLAAGRTPNTEALLLQNAGVKANERGFIKVNNKLETNVRGIYALGDVKGGPAFTHIAYNDYLVVCKNLLDGGRESIKNRIIPYCMFIDPELGRVGLNEDAAKEQGLDFKVAKLEMAHVARGIEAGETAGFMKVIVDTKTKKLLGITVLGAGGGEIMSVLQIAMQAGLTYTMLRENIFAHPTYVESINNLFMTLDNE